MPKFVSLSPGQPPKAHYVTEKLSHPTGRIPRDAYQIGNIPKSEIALQELLEGCIDRHTLTTVLANIEQVLQYKIEHIDDCWQDKTLAKRWGKTRQAIAKALTIAHAYGL